MWNDEHWWKHLPKVQRPNEAAVEKLVPIYTASIDEAFQKAGLKKSKAMTTLITRLVIQEQLSELPRILEIILDFGRFAQEAGLGSDPLRPVRGEDDGA